MMQIATRSSTTARVSRNSRSADGRREPTTASTATANAMSVAVGIAQPRIVSAARAQVDQHVEQRRHRHPAERRRDRHDRAVQAPQVARDELLLQLQADQEEEDRQQAVRRPVPQAQVEVEAEHLAADVQVAQRGVGVAREVRPDHRDDRAGDEQHAAHRLHAQDLGDALVLRPAGAGEDTTAAVSPGAGGRSGRAGVGHVRASSTWGHDNDVPTRLPGAPESILPAAARGGVR